MNTEGCSELAEQLAEIFQIKSEELIAFDTQYIFNNYGNPSQGIACNNFPEKMQQLYEDKQGTIWILCSKRVYLLQMQKNALAQGRRRD